MSKYRLQAECQLATAHFFFRSGPVALPLNYYRVEVCELENKSGAEPNSLDREEQTVYFYLHLV